MDPVLTVVAAASLALCVYTYIAYPTVLWVWGRFRPHAAPAAKEPEGWPFISISLPAHNEEATIGGAIESLLAADYPSDRRQIVVISDASTDRTDSIVRTYVDGDRGVEFLRLPERGGKTAAENAARFLLRGAIVINTDASARVHSQALKHLVAGLRDPSIGVASARDVSVRPAGDAVSAGEASYVGYEMWVRGLETRVFGIVGASGCCYAIRTFLHRLDVSEALSRDFAAALLAREHGLRAVSVPEAICYVPPVSSLPSEYRRKVRTIDRGLATLWNRRRLLNPVRYGVFAWMLFSHKLCRWLVPWALLGAGVALGVLSVEHGWARWTAGVASVGVLICGAGWVWPAGRPMPRLVAVPAFVVGGLAATLQAWIKGLYGNGAPIWEPSRREPVDRSITLGP